LWTIDDWGIFIADYAAAGRWKELQDLHIQITIQNISAQEAYSSTVTAGQWYWGNQDGLPVEVLSLKDVVAKHRMPKYLDDRDDNRMGDGRPAYWRGIPLEHIALAFDIAKGTIGSIMRLIRIIFDKGWHGGNRRKGFPNGLEQDLAGRCEICLRQDSQYHWLSECCYPEATAIREKVIGLLGAAVSNHFRDNERNLGRVGEFIMTGLLRADAKRFWLGHWSETMVASLDEYLSIWDFKPVDGADIRGALDEYAEILANGASLLWDSKLRESNHCRRSRIGPGWSTPEGPQPANDTLRQERARGSMSDSRGRQRPTATPGLRQLTMVELDVRNLSRRRDAESRRLQQECAAAILDIPFRSRRLGDPGPRVDPQDTPFVVPPADDDTGADAEEISISIASLYGEEQRDNLSPISEMAAVIVDLVQETTEATGTAAAVCEQDMHVVTEPPPPEQSSPPAQPTPPTGNDPRPMSMRSFSFPDGDWIPDVLRHTDLLEAMEEISFRGDVPLYVYGGVNVSTRDLANMQDGSFIRDEAINLFGALFNADVHPRAHVFPTQFGLALSDSDFTRTLTNYQQTVVPGEYPMLYFPVNIARCHWVLVVADVIHKTLVYLDSIFNPYLGVPHWVLTIG
jgi:hypothetical protein